MVTYVLVRVTQSRSRKVSNRLAFIASWVGYLMWLVSQSRSDTANAVRAVARYANSMGEIHWKTAVGILLNDAFHELF